MEDPLQVTHKKPHQLAIGAQYHFNHQTVHISAPKIIKDNLVARGNDGSLIQTTFKWIQVSCIFTDGY